MAIFKNVIVNLVKLQRDTMKRTPKQMLIIFGASGDLTARKLVPALFNLFRGQHLPENFVVLGASRSNLTDEAFRKKVVYESEYLKNELSENNIDFIKDFSEKIFYEDLGGAYDTEYSNLKRG